MYAIDRQISDSTAHGTESCNAGRGGPFDLDAADVYRRWRAHKLAGYPRDPDALQVRVDNPCALDPDERTALTARCRKANMAIYELTSPEPLDAARVTALGRQFGLERLDHNLCAGEQAVSALRVNTAGRSGGYIPYTNQRLGWHTDGIYNPPDQQVRGFILHCNAAAACGGASFLLDHELAYILLRDENPAYVAALMQPDVLSIPANVEAGTELRGAQSGPVFSVDARGCLHMRYTARRRHIEWKDDALTQEARHCLARLLRDDSPYVFHVRLQPGQGLLCNNVLHGREAFEDDPTGQRRELLRGRYFDRIADTEPGTPGAALE